MVSDVRLLSYLDKIGLILTGEAGQAPVCLYSEARLCKGARMAPLSQSTTTRSTGNISVGEESRPLQHTWNSKLGLCSFPLKFTAAQKSTFSTD
jgi:hypothetical protein